MLSRSPALVLFLPYAIADRFFAACGHFGFQHIVLRLYLGKLLFFGSLGFN
jgi:hypothetical protein